MCVSAGLDTTVRIPFPDCILCKTLDLASYPDSMQTVFNLGMESMEYISVLRTRIYFFPRGCTSTLLHADVVVLVGGLELPLGYQVLWSVVGNGCMELLLRDGREAGGQPPHRECLVEDGGRGMGGGGGMFRLS